MKCKRRGGSRMIYVQGEGGFPVGDICPSCNGTAEDVELTEEEREYVSYLWEWHNLTPTNIKDLHKNLVKKIVENTVLAERERILARLSKKGCNPHKEWHEGYNFAIDEITKAIKEA